jgi:chromosome segregation ATPase
MSVPRQSVPTRDEDLESTAELPVLDVANYEAKLAEEGAGHTDTWVIPPSVSTALAVAHVSEAAPVNDAARTQLEVDLRALSESLREVEERLTRKGERLAQIERELSVARDERVAVERRAESLNIALEIARTGLSNAETRATDLQRAVERLEADARDRAAQAEAEARTRASQEQQAAAQFASREQSLHSIQSELRAAQSLAAGYLETLQSLEGRRMIFDDMLSSLDQDVARREADLAQLQDESSKRASQIRELQSQLGDRERRIAALERENNALAVALSQRDEQLEGSVNARDKLRESVASMTELLTQRAERIRSLEASVAHQSQTEVERQRTLEQLTSERDRFAASVASLELALDVAKADAARQVEVALSADAARSEAEAQAAAARAQAEMQAAAAHAHAQGLETTLAAVRAELDARVVAQRQTESEISGLLARVTEAEALAAETQRESTDQVEAIRVLQEELRSSGARMQELESDLHAAEDTINRLETDLRAKSGKLEEVTKTNEEWRDTVESARQVLSERESLIRRLEAEAANSAVLLGSIQQSIKRLDTSNSGTHEVVPEGAVRLLIRTDGDSEVVHVLSRKTSIGRTPDNDLQIDARFISRHHAVILAGPTHTIIEDLNSTNGVLVNKRRITRHTLCDGDSVSIGKTVFRFAVRGTGNAR